MRHRDADEEELVLAETPDETLTYDPDAPGMSLRAQQHLAPYLLSNINATDDTKT